MEQKIVFIGGGHMSGAIVSGLTQAGYTPASITVTNRSQEKRDHFSQRFGVQVSSDNLASVQWADMVVLAVKPQALLAVCHEIASVIRSSQIVISIAAGIRIAQIKSAIQVPAGIIRAMPNMAATVRGSATALYAKNLDEPAKQAAQAIFNEVGSAVWLSDEAQLSMVTALSGSGPAYYFLLTETLITAAIELGLPAEIATELAEQTALGAAQLIRQDEQDSRALRHQVTSAKGTTAAAMDVLQERDFQQIIKAALVAANQRAIELNNTAKRG